AGDGHRGRGAAVGQERQTPVVAVGRGAVVDGDGVPVRRVPQPPVAVLPDGRGGGGARRRQPAPVPRPGPRVPGGGATAHRQPPEAHDGGGGLPVRGHHAAGRVVEGGQRE